VRLRHVRIPGEACCAENESLVDVCAAFHADRAEVEQRHGLPQRGLEGDRPASAGDGACERDDAFGRCEHGRADRGRDVDATMLPGRIRMAAVEIEAAQDVPVHRPGPGAGGSGGERERAYEQDAESPHGTSSFVVRTANITKVAGGWWVVNTGYKVRR
jgi:hypothetical protein